MDEAFVLAVAAAFSLGLAAVFQQHAMQGAAARQGTHPGHLPRQLMQPTWLVGVLIMLVGYGLQGTALRLGAVTSVEPVLSSSLLLALPVSAFWLRQRLKWRDWLGVFAAASGIAGFLVVARPQGGAADARTDAWLAILACVAAISLIVLSASWSRGSGWRALGLAAVGGLGLGIADAITKPVVSALAAGPVDVLMSWQVYALVAIGGLAFLLIQNAYRAGHIGRSLPAVTVLEPLTASIVGILLFGERVHSQPPAIALESLSVLAALGGVCVLAQSPLTRVRSGYGEDGRHSH